MLPGCGCRPHVPGSEALTSPRSRPQQAGVAQSGPSAPLEEGPQPRLLDLCLPVATEEGLPWNFDSPGDLALQVTPSL